MGIRGGVGGLVARLAVFGEPFRLYRSGVAERWIFTNSEILEFTVLVFEKVNKIRGKGAHPTFTPSTSTFLNALTDQAIVGKGRRNVFRCGEVQRDSENVCYAKKGGIIQVMGELCGEAAEAKPCDAQLSRDEKA